MLRGVVQRGTAAAAASIEWPLAGKTGTVDDNTDAWFIGFDPDITVGVWVGLGRKEAARHKRDRRGGGPADLDGVHEGVHRRPAGPGQPPSSMRQATSCSWRSTARRARPAIATAEGAITETFIAGTQPGGGAFR